MTTLREKRCRHCQVRYTYRASGYSPIRQLCTNRYCSGCAEAQRLALEEIPRKFEEVYIPVTDVSLEQILEWVQQAAYASASGFMGPWAIFRVRSCLYDLADPSNHNRTGYVMGRDEHAHRYFAYSYWTKKDKVEIEERMERNLSTGEEQPWKDLG